MGIDWPGIKKDLEKGAVSIREMALKYKCDRSTIRRRAKKEGWERRREAGEPGLKKNSRRDEPAGLDNVLDDHKSLWRGVKKRLIKGLHNNDAKTGLEDLKVAKMAGEVLSNVIRGERMAWGVEAGEDNSEGHDDPEEIISEMARITLPPGAGEAAD
ncbi:MAG: hypothetical protein HY954_07890 [Deltaproteobacteria bacterium]|nr:hypothetical protein [Deltaproteobacteria bacterium]